MLDLRLSGINRFLVVGVAADGRTEPASERGEDFGVGERTPLHYFGLGFEVFGDEGCVGILAGDYNKPLLLKAHK